ncbi:MAG: zinc ribbon domain-containing protein [Ruminococcus sp.]|nr:zinc ribbon domain-containing protein [Ruminococcus sp.]
MEELFVGIFGLFYLAIIIGMPFVWGFVCRKVVRDKGYPDNMNHGFLWGFFLGIVGLIVCACKQNYVDPMLYMNNMYYQPGNRVQQYPPSYGQVPPDYSQNYAQGYQPQQYQYDQPQAPVYPTQWMCRSCGSYNAPDANFCSQCGARKE